MLKWVTKNGSCHHYCPITGQTLAFDYANYDKVGNRLSMKKDSDNAQVYQYDKLYQLKAVDYNDGTTASYEYDKMGNRTRVMENQFETLYDSNALNQYTNVGGAIYTYDKNGNLTSDGTYIYIYDCENRLIEVLDDGGENTVAEYKYDFAGRRVIKSVGAVDSNYCYDGDRIIVEYNNVSSPALARRFYYGPGIDEPICMQRLGNVYYYHFDGLGNVIALNDSSGNIVEKYSYDVFGKPTIRGPSNELRDTSSVGNRFMFTGREFDYETGNYYYRARYYKPSIGRFLQPDPVIMFMQYASVQQQIHGNIPGKYIAPNALKRFMHKDPIGRFLAMNSYIGVLGANHLGVGLELNLYTYCYSNPLKYIDPYGLIGYDPYPNVADPSDSTPFTGNPFPPGPDYINDAANAVADAASAAAKAAAAAARIASDYATQKAREKGRDAIKDIAKDAIIPGDYEDEHNLLLDLFDGYIDEAIEHHWEKQNVDKLLNGDCNNTNSK